MNPEDFLSLLIRRGLPLDLPDLVPQIDGLGLQPADSLRELPMFPGGCGGQRQGAGGTSAAWAH